MYRYFIFFFPLLLISSLMLNSTVYGDNHKASACLECHEKEYTKGITSRYTHSAFREDCTTCHYIEDVIEDKPLITSLYYQKSIILNLTTLLDKDKRYDKNKKYVLHFEASNVTGEKAKPVVIDINTQKIWNRPEEAFNITQISDLIVESVKKGMFAKAVITWTTDVPSTTEVEYGSFTKNKRVFSPKSHFTKDHKVILRGLSNRGKYIFKVTSWDMNGNILQSENLNLNTSRSFDLASDPGIQEPVIENLMLFNIEQGKDLFVKVSANTPIKFKVRIKETRRKTGRQHVGFEQSRESTINACINCHEQDASHPVGVRSSDPNIRIPDELPTIENGVVTCVTCHYPHGGEKEYLLRIKFSKEICVKCHKNKYN